jgi:hypothetical protein
MGLILMLLMFSLVVTVLQVVVLVFLWRESQPGDAPAANVAPRVAPSRFFGTQPVSTPATADAATLALVLQQLEQHIRAERAAAESYHWTPTISALHEHTTSPLIH